MLVATRLVCANGDGQLAPEEREWAIGHSAAFGAPDSWVDELKSYKADEDSDNMDRTARAPPPSPFIVLRRSQPVRMSTRR